MRAAGKEAPLADVRMKPAFEALLYNIGKWVYLADAWEDRERDARTGAYNVFNVTGAEAERAGFLMHYSIHEAIKAYELLDIAVNREILVIFCMMAVLHERRSCWEESMNNPYKVLGVSEGASQEEIRAAYLKLVKKYHPDKYTDTDLKELANEKLVEINEAYEALTKKNGSTQASGSGAGAYSNYGYSGQGSTYSGPNAADFARARAFINQNNLQAAKQVLDTISVRNAEWYYLYGIIYLRQGWYDKANDYISRAYHQEPGNAEYANAYKTLRTTGNPYTRQASGYDSSCSGCDVCSGLLCADCCCECMGGDLIRCC